MSHLVKAGRETSEHARAWRAEVFGFAIGTLGLLLIATALVAHGQPPMEQIGAGVLLVAISAWLIGWNSVAYMKARSAPKAAVARPPAVQADPRI